MPSRFDVKKGSKMRLCTSSDIPVPWSITLYLFGILDEKLLVLSAFATLPVTIGLLIGQRIRQKISQSWFEYLIIGILVVSGLSMLWRAYQ